MKVFKYIIIVFVILFFIANQFDKKLQKSSDSNNDSGIENSNSVQVNETTLNNDYENTGEQQGMEADNTNQYNSYCSFETDGAVLQYLIGKTFTQKDGNAQITFSTDGANLSGKKDYQWLSYQTLGSFKGIVKLSSLDMNNPDGVLTLWVSCKENAVTDGSIVLLNN